MVRPASLLIVALALSACPSKPKTFYKDPKVVSLNSVDIVMQLPSSFQEYSLTEEIDYWTTSGLPDDVVDKKIAYLESLMLSSDASQFLADSMNLINNLRIMELPVPIKVGKYTSSKGFLILDEMIQAQAAALGIKYEALENDYFSLANGNDVMKIRYKATESRINTASLAPFSFDEGTIVYYTTFYLVTGKKTLSIAVNHEFEDFEYFIRTIRFQ